MLAIISLGGLMACLSYLQGSKHYASDLAKVKNIVLEFA